MVTRRDFRRPNGGPKGGLWRPKGGQADPQRSSEYVSGTSLETLLGPQAPCRKSLFYVINGYILASGEGPGTPNVSKRAPKDAPEKEENNQVEKTEGGGKKQREEYEQKVCHVLRETHFWADLYVFLS